VTKLSKLIAQSILRGGWATKIRWPKAFEDYCFDRLDTSS
jgi:hypothetical protein